ncbi:hypothetical protein NL676_012539 [Syzygium grande]|nr:hypothetical protein NL676_012539 [Syzygium grande]
MPRCTGISPTAWRLTTSFQSDGAPLRVGPHPPEILAVARERGEQGEGEPTAVTLCFPVLPVKRSAEKLSCVVVGPHSQRPSSEASDRWPISSLALEI